MRKKVFIALQFLLLFLLIVIIRQNVIAIDSQQNIETLPQLETANQYYRLSKQLDKQSKLHLAREAAIKSIELDATHHKAQIMLGYVLTRMGEFVAARAPLENAFTLSAQDKTNLEIALFNLALAYFKEKKAEESWRYFKEALAVGSPAGKSLWSDDAQYIQHVLKDEKDLFIEHVTKTESWPREVHWRDNYLRDLYNPKVGMSREERMKTVFADSTQYLKDNPGSIYSYLFYEYQASALSYLKQYQASLDLLEIVEAMDIRDTDRQWVLESKAFNYWKMGEYERSLDLSEKLVEEYPKYEGRLEALYTMADSYARLGYLDQEQETLLKIIKDYPDKEDNKHAYAQLGGSYMLDGQYRKSFENYIKADLGYLTMAYLASIFAGVFAILLIFFLLKRVPLFKRKGEIAPSKFKLMDFFVVLFLSYSVPFVLSMKVLEWNYYFPSFLKAFSLDPMMLSSFGSDFFLAAVCLFILKKRYQLNREQLGFVRRGIKWDILVPIVVVVVSIVWADVYFRLLEHFKVLPPAHYLEKLSQNVISEQNVFKMVFFFTITVTLGPIVEELVFRVYFLNFFKGHLNTVSAVILSALMFALFHNSMVLAPFYFVLGLLLAVVYLRSKSIVPAMVAHGLYNLMVFVL